MPPLPDEFALALARAANRLGVFAEQISWLPSVTSTNDVVLTRADRGAREGEVVVADVQERGRGRLGRTWASPPGAGIYASVLLRPPADAVPFVTLATGVALVEGIERAAGFRPVLKWPNDVYVPGSTGLGRKLGGILAEGGASQGVAHVVVGIGINVRQAAYPPDVAARATSIEDELGRSVERGLVLAECLASLWTRYSELRSGRASNVLQAWRVLARHTFGRRVEYWAEDRVVSGTAEGIDDTGALVVRTAMGMARVISGEVKWH